MKKLYRSNKNKVIAGVCSGLGEYLAISPKIFRVLFVVGLLYGVYPSIIAYLVLWVILEQSPVNKGGSKTDTGNIVDVDVTVKSD